VVGPYEHVSLNFGFHKWKGALQPVERLSAYHELLLPSKSKRAARFLTCVQEVPKSSYLRGDIDHTDIFLGVSQSLQ
jgi:hypothetical protein